MSDHHITTDLSAAIGHELKTTQDCLCMIASRHDLHVSTARKIAKELMRPDELAERERKARALVLERMQELLSSGVTQEDACRSLGISIWFYKSVRNEAVGEKEPEQKAAPSDAVQVLSLGELGQVLQRKTKDKMRTREVPGTEVTVRFGRLEACYRSNCSAEASVASLMGMLREQGVL